MMHTFTKNDLVAYCYGDTTPAQADATEAALAGDPVLRHELTELTEAQAALPRLRFQPKKRLLAAIRRYAAGEPKLAY